jgi:cytochrome c-type biogenesis protein CcmH/NrfG
MSDGLKSDVAVLEVHQTFLSAEIKELAKEADAAAKRAEAREIKRASLATLQQDLKELQALAHDLQASRRELDNKRREFEEKTALAHAKVDILSAAGHRSNRDLLVHGVFMVVALLYSTWGFRMWYRWLQHPQDRCSNRRFSPR